MKQYEMMRFTIIVVCAVVGCNEVANSAARPTADPECVVALDHIKRCDERFADHAILCEYSSWGECAPYINAAQSQCLRASACEAVRTAIDKRDWLCGVPLSASSH
jgi:hypothetical protein